MLTIYLLADIGLVTLQIAVNSDWAWRMTTIALIT